MRRLPNDFFIEKYGLLARLVQEGDADFIFKMRTDPKLSKYVNKVEGDVEQQKKWIRDYKMREEKGTDYYFIFYKDHKAIGLYRIYDFKEDTFKSGSWLFSTEAPFGSAFLAQLILREIAFINWGYKYEFDPDGVLADNVNVLKFDYNVVGMKEEGRYMSNLGEMVSVSLTKDDFLKGRKKILRMLGMND